MRLYVYGHCKYINCLKLKKNNNNKKKCLSFVTILTITHLWKMNKSRSDEEVGRCILKNN